VVWSQDDFPAKYANCFRIGINAFELMLDFAQCSPDRGIAVLHTRIIVAPVYGKIFLRLLSVAIADYEATHGGQMDSTGI
jgi:Protein of unknown function (DUF3467)